jgi:oxygen-independent coproporphyrinogen-3 oxidase
LLLGLYIHFPFCEARCPYCDFTSFTGASPADHSRYTSALKKELALRLEELEGKEVSFDTVFLGGGTPSLPDPEQLEELLEIIETLKAESLLMPRAEITVELNPESLDMEKAELLKEYGVNRVSVGVQSLQDEELKPLGRLHDAQKAVEAVTLLRMRSLTNISLDLMYGIPGQSIESWEDTLRQASLLSQEHVSAYALSLDPDNPAYTDDQLPREDEVREMYFLATKLLPAEGLAQYEISNFAKPGLECRHNLRYWRREPYMGIGVSAAGFLNGERWVNTKNLDEYLNALEEERLPEKETDVIQGEQAAREHLILNLRLKEGASFKTFRESYGLDVRQLLESEFVPEEREKLFAVRADSVSLTTEGFFLSDEVFRRIV